MFQKYASLPLLQKSLLILGIGGWVTVLTLHSTNHSLIEENKLTHENNDRILRITHHLRNQALQEKSEKKAMELAFKTKLEELSTELDHWTQVGKEQTEKNTKLTQRVRNLERDNTELMEANSLLANRNQDLEETVHNLQESPQALLSWPWQQSSAQSHQDKKLIAKLQDENRTLLAERNEITQRMDKLYEDYQRQLMERSAAGSSDPGSDTPASVARQNASAAPVSLGTLSLTKDEASFRNFTAARKPQAKAQSGRIVSVNSENAYAIVNLGDHSGIRRGQPLIAKRGEDEIAKLYVIETRDSFAACDIEYLTANFRLAVNDNVYLMTSK